MVASAVPSFAVAVNFHRWEFAVTVSFSAAIVTLNGARDVMVTVVETDADWSVRSVADTIAVYVRRDAEPVGPAYV